jgi:hypothetical protein
LAATLLDFQGNSFRTTHLRGPSVTGVGEHANRWLGGLGEGLSLF